MRNNKVIVVVIAGVAILASAVSYQFHSIFQVTDSHQPEIPRASQAAQTDRVTLLSKEDIIGKLPSIFPGALDAATTGSCGIQLPSELPESLAQ